MPKFLLCSSAKAIAREHLSSILGTENFSGIPLFFCLTAAAKDHGSKNWIIKDLLKLKNFGFEVDICDLNGLNADNVLARVQDAKVLFFEGGDTPYLLHSIMKSQIHLHFPELLTTRVWIGVSAGACVLSPLIYPSCDYWFKPNPPATPEKGLGLVDFQFIPHYQSKYFPQNTKENLVHVTNNLEKLGIEKSQILTDEDVVWA